MFKLSSKVFCAQEGILFLYGDSNGFYENIINKEKNTEKLKINNIINEEIKFCFSKDILYKKFIIEDKTTALAAYNSPEFHLNAQEINLKPGVYLAEKIDCVEYIGFQHLKPTEARSLFYAGDSHINVLGGFLVAGYILNNLDCKFIEYNKSKDNLITISYFGDLYDSLKDEEKKILLNHLISNGYPLYPRSCLDLPTHYMNNIITTDLNVKNLYHSYVEYENLSAEIDKTILIFRQSSGKYPVKILSKHFKNVIDIWNTGEFPYSLVDRHKIDIIVHLITERFCWRYYD